jgi:hypothetical protein
MLKPVVANLEEVPEAFRPEYKPGDDGKFVLDIEVADGKVNHPAVTALLSAKQREAEARTKAEGKARELAEKLEATILEKENLLKGTVPKDNFAALEASYKERSEREKGELKTALEGEITKLSGSLKTVLVDNVARSIATGLAINAESIPLFLPFIAPRLTVEMDADGHAKTRVVDKEGKPSAATLEDLAKEISALPMFAPLIIGSKATGSSADGGHAGGSAPAKKLDLSKATLAEKEAYYKARNQGR